MMQQVSRIRTAGESDQEAIRRLHLHAFGPSEGEAVAQLVMDLLADPTARPMLSLVAEGEQGILGHVLFTPILLDEGGLEDAYILAPLAVSVESQGRGVGTALIDHGLEMLRERDASLVMVLGDPQYYGRSGFKAGHRLKAPHPLEHPEAWMVLPLQDDALSGLDGTIRCADALDQQTHW